jgi:hypothetical protein
LRERCGFVVTGGDLVDHRAHHNVVRAQNGAVGMHRPQHRLAGGVDERDAVEVDPDRGRRRDPQAPPAGGELVHPQADDSPLERDRRVRRVRADADAQHVNVSAFGHPASAGLS